MMTTMIVMVMVIMGKSGKDELMMGQSVTSQSWVGEKGNAKLRGSQSSLVGAGSWPPQSLVGRITTTLKVRRRGWGGHDF